MQCHSSILNIMLVLNTAGISTMIAFTDFKFSNMDLF